MLAEFSIYPMDRGHMSKDVAKVVETLDSTGLNYRLGPMGTCVEGEWEQVMSAIRACHGAVSADHARVVTSIVIDEQKDRPHTLDAMVSSVEHQLGHAVRH